MIYFLFYFIKFNPEENEQIIQQLMDMFLMI